MPNQINNHYQASSANNCAQYIVRAFVFHEEPLRPPCDLIRDRSKIKIKLTLFYNFVTSANVGRFSKLFHCHLHYFVNIRHSIQKLTLMFYRVVRRRA